MRALTTLLVLALASIFPTLSASAQDAVGISPGTRVRVVAAQYVYEGTFLAFRADSMVVEPDGWDRPVMVALGSLRWLDVRRGRRWVQGAGIGALLGSALGGAASLAVNVLLTSEDGDPSAGVAAGVASGFIIGGTVGAVMAGDRWNRLSIHELRLLPPVRRAVLGVRLLALRF